MSASRPVKSTEPNSDLRGSDSPARPEPGDHAGVMIACFDFHTRDHCLVFLPAVTTAVADGRFLWIDIDAEIATTAEVLRHLPTPTAASLRSAFEDSAPEGDQISALARGDGWLRLRLVGIRFNERDLARACLDIVINDQMLITAHRGRSDVLEAVRQDYLNDFLTHAATPSFLI